MLVVAGWDVPFEVAPPNRDDAGFWPVASPAGLAPPNNPPAVVEVVAGAEVVAEVVAVLFPKRPPAGAVVVVAPEGADVVAPVVPNRPPEVAAGAEVVGALGLLPKSEVPELVAWVPA